MRRRWHELDQTIVERRYDKIAPFYKVLEVLWLPPGLRRLAVESLALKRGDRVLEVGCGTGSNLPLLAAAVGERGTVSGVDRSLGMLAMAAERIRRRGLRNCTIFRSDAAEYALPHRVDAALFSLSYATMVHRSAALHHAWESLEPGGRLVIFDSKPPPGRVGKIVREVMFWVSRASVLGNPDVRAWEDVEHLTPFVQVREYFGGLYFVLRATKEGHADVDGPSTRTSR